MAKPVKSATAGARSETAQIHREWLKNLPEITGVPLTKIAQESKVAPSTLTRPIKEGENGTSTLHANTIAKVVEKFGVTPPVGLDSPSPGARVASSGFRGDASPYQPEPGNTLAAGLEALIGSNNGLTPWLIKSRALELAGYVPGDVILVDLNATPKPGEAVCAQVRDWKRGTLENVVRLFERASPIELLLPRSLDPNMQDPLVVDRERVTILGVVLPYRLREREPAA